MYLLAKITKERGIKVVLTGEGSDEVLLGYDLYKETKVRRFCLRQPTSARRPMLFDRLYPYLNTNGRGGSFWPQFFLTAGAPHDPLFSHMPRFLLTARIKEFYSDEVRDALGGVDVMQELRDDLPSAYSGWSDLERAAWLEVTTLLSGYLLSSQGDRMAMAHGMEGRFPFLDHRLHAFASRLPTRALLRGLREKDLLRRWADVHLPTTMPRRTKQPYRAPDVAAFYNDGPAPTYRDEVLGDDALRRAGLFDRDAVGGLIRRCESGRATGFHENQAMVGILSAQIWHQTFFQTADTGAVLPPEGADVLLGSATEAVHAGHTAERYR
jgi:asparagine synthase (glutamine-hydrolysing)